MSPFTKTIAASALALGTLASVTLASTESAQAGNYWGPAVAAGVFGLAAGAIIASQAYPYGPYGGYAPGYAPVYAGQGCWVGRPVYNRWGHFVGYRRVFVC
jgi:hypothetical protein